MNLIINGNTATWNEQPYPCTFGANGFTHHKREGDGCTPVGEFKFRRAFYRADRITPVTLLPLSVITQRCGWCDDPTSPLYNTYIQKPFAASHEDLWLEKDLYNLLIVVGHNDEPPTPHMGSAIFIHLASPGFGPTKGCIGLRQEDLMHILSQATTECRLIIEE
jgi:L,D-peptidoglycan transpeptidase YkuD (ErfK/YbiS/YcfS/YnhG family)